MSKVDENLSKNPRGIDPKYLLDLSQQAFYRRYFGFLLATLLAAIACITMLVGGFVWIKNQKVEREYFSVEQGTGRMTRLVPMNEPHMDEATLRSWVQDCVVRSNTYDFVNYQHSFNDVRSCFTNSGWDQYTEAITSAGTLETIKTQRLVMSAVADGTPVILQTGLSNGITAWQVQLPITVAYQGQGGRATVNQRMLVTLVVTNVPTFESKEGVGILQYVAKER